MSAGVHFSDLAGRRALVTGASMGIGRGITEALLEQGAVVFGVALDSDPRDASSHYHPIRCDLTNVDQLESAVAQVADGADSLDYLVNVAGRDPKHRLEEGDAKCWQSLVDLNLRAYYLLIRSALPLLRAGHGKSIVNISSINYRLGLPGRSIYSTTKAGILGLTRGLARELGAEGIRINTISPGWVMTERQVEEYFQNPDDRARHRGFLHEKQAIDRQISPRDIANHVLFYLSEASAASTGHNCVVDAGWLLE